MFDLAYAYVAAGEPNTARAMFARADTAHPHYAAYRALLHGILGEPDEALAWFDRAELVADTTDVQVARLAL